MNSSIIIGIPGDWEDRSAITTSIARGYKFLFAGMLLLEIETSKSCELEIYGYDPHLTRAFEIAGKGYIPQAVLHRLSSHRHTLYAVADSPSIETATWMLKVGASLLDAVGIAVKVESAGLAHTAEDWFAFAADSSPSAVYNAFVTLIGGQNYYYSCGMQNFGLPDASLSRSIEPQVASEILHEFNYYQLVEKPLLADGHTFSTAPEAPSFRIVRCSYEGYEDTDPLYNSFGRWHLENI
ncbi:MAG: DUF4261 domain-containing protein [Cyanosarcina radialis HA8281-LM2]|jgi:hypothetical protein|nr:DUF4261 domain-containing protein [Cyanosarcina radialis HA8281-LM2]